MAEDTKNKLQEILEYEAREIALSYEKASIEGRGTPQEIADRREECFKSFLQKYFPFPYRIVKGNIIDSYGKSSASIDCIVLNPSHPYTIDASNQKASVIMADGVDYAIEIKPDLANDKEIIRALDQIRSVKKLRRVKDGIIFHRRHNEEQLMYVKTVPSFIVADKTYKDIEKLIIAIVDYYVVNKIPRVEQFDLLLVNNRAVIYNNSVNSYVQHLDKRTISVYECDQKALGAFIYEMNLFVRCEPMLGKNIMEIYLRGCRPDEVYGFPDLFKRTTI